MANARAHVATDALGLLGDDAELAEAGIDIHERRQRAGKAAPDAAGKPEVERYAEDAGPEQIDRPDVVEVTHQPANLRSVGMFALEQQAVRCGLPAAGGNP